jgi:hypothetical protein
MARETGGYGMNAKESLAADRIAEECWYDAEKEEPDSTYYLRAIAAELRAARIYANYLEGRQNASRSQKRDSAARVS